jgi:hypothetical protein
MMRVNKITAAALSGLCAFVPLFAGAEGAVQGGFPSHSIWLSKTELTAGDSVTIFAPLYNAGSGKVEGDAVFLVDDAPIGSIHISLGAGETKIASLAWSAVQGTHAISAEIDNALDSDSKASVSLSGLKTEKISVTVAVPPPPPPVIEAAGAAFDAIKSGIAAVAPAVSSATGAVLGATENLRTEAANALAASIASTDTGAPSTSSLSVAGTADAGEVLGATTVTPAAALAAAVTSGSSFSILRFFEAVLLFLVGYTWVFYPLFIALLLFLIYYAGKRLARSRPA